MTPTNAPTTSVTLADAYDAAERDYAAAIAVAEADYAAALAKAQEVRPAHAPAHDYAHAENAYGRTVSYPFSLKVF